MANSINYSRRNHSQSHGNGYQPWKGCRSHEGRAGMYTTYNVQLDCVHCGEGAEQVLTYVGGLLVLSYCHWCGYEVHKSRELLRAEYLRDLRHRVGTKSHRLRGEARVSLPSFVLGMPRRLVTKPLRLLDEIVEVEFGRTPRLPQRGDHRRR